LQLIEHRRIIIPNDEKLIAQLTSRRKLYDSRGREKLESKADLASRGVESRRRSRVSPFELDGRMVDSKARFQVAAYRFKKFIIAFYPRFD
jgi:hypothetical protein